MKTYEKYKPSEVEWIGEIPEHWEVKSIKRFSAIKNGATPSSNRASYWNGNIIWITPSDLSKLNSKYIRSSERMITKQGLNSCGTNPINKGTIIISTRAPIGTVAIADTILCTNQGCKSITLKNQSPEFLYYILLISKDNLNGLGKGTTFMELSNYDLGLCKVPFPALPEQQTIASYLDKKSEAIDKFIKNKEELIALLEEEKKAIITKAVTKGLDKDVKLKDSGVEWLGKIPEHWEFRRLATFGRFSKGSGLPKADLVKDGVPAILYGDIYTKYNLKAVNIINHVTEKSSLGAKNIKKGDILFTGSGETKEDIGKCIVYLGDEKVYAGGDIIIFYQKKYDSLFLSYSLNSNLAIDQKIVSSKGEIIVHIYSSKLKEIYIPIPPLSEQQTIASYLDEQTKKIDDLKAKYRQEIDLIKEYKERLIYDVVTGKINLTQEASHVRL